MRIPRNVLATVLLVVILYGSGRKAIASPQNKATFDQGHSRLQDSAENEVHPAACHTALDSHNAERLLLLGEYRHAIVILKRLKQCDSGDMALREKLIIAYSKSNQKQQAIEEAESATNGASPEEKIYIAHVLNANGEFLGAQAMLKTLLNSGFVSAGVHGELGIAFLGQGLYKESVQELGTAVQLDGSSERYSLELARALLSWRNYPTALDFLNAIVDRFAKNTMYLYEKGWAYYGMHRFSDAVEILQTLVQKEPNWDLAQYSLGNAYSMQGHMANAEARYRTAIKLNSRGVAYYTALGRVLREKNGALPEAISSLNKAIALEPHNAPAEFELALAYKSERKLEKAKYLLEDVISREPSMVDAHRTLGLVYYQLHSPDDGAKQMSVANELDTKALQQNPASTPVRENLAYR